MAVRRLGRLRAVRAGSDRHVGNIGGLAGWPPGYEEEHGDKGRKAVNVTRL
jgi:hypothetical protein